MKSIILESIWTDNPIPSSKTNPGYSKRQRLEADFLLYRWQNSCKTSFVGGPLSKEWKIIHMQSV